VTLNLSGDGSGSAQTDNSGNYQLNSIAAGNYTLIPAGLRDLMPVIDPKPDTGDAQLVQAHFQSGGTLLTGCQELAAHVTGNMTVDVGDALAIQQFFANNPLAPNNGTGKWRFMPAQRTYTPLSSDQSNQNYDSYVLGDVTGAVVFPTP
jgi:hypothetical protein